ncbi:MAG: hypothetical protein ACKO7W_04695 [Elainella sp.]
MTVATAPNVTETQVASVVEAILDVLGTPTTKAEKEVLAAFEARNFDAVRRIAAANLSNNFCKALGYLGSAYKLLPNTDTILAESARAAAAHAEDRALHLLSEKISAALILSPQI